jgi:hypothetical protein
VSTTASANLGSVAQALDDHVHKIASHQHNTSDADGIITLRLHWRDALVVTSMIKTQLAAS